MKRFHKIRTEIARLSQQQIELKPQRKTVNLKVERTIDANQATWKVQNTAKLLMHLYHAYAKMKGIELPLPKRQEINPVIIKTYMDSFAPEPIEELVA